MIPDTKPLPRPAKIFISYSTKDRRLLDHLQTHLAALKREGLISTWIDRDVLPSADWAREINDNLDSANLVLLLVSAHFIESDYCAGIEFQKARALEAKGLLRIVPVILRPCEWKSAALGLSQYQCLPSDGRSLTTWRERDAGLANIISGLRRLFEADPVVALTQRPSSRPVSTSPATTEVDPGSKYARYKISMIVKRELRDQNFNIDNLDLDRGINVRDLEALCARLYFTVQSREKIIEAIGSARAAAFTAKYAQPGEDEKLIDLCDLRIEGTDAATVKPWHHYLDAVLANSGIDDLAELNVIDVGAGHGLTCNDFYARLRNLTAVDISEKALTTLRNNAYEHVKTHVAAAERLDGIESGSMDLYVSFRTFQSTLFDRRSAITEAFRVLSYGGRLVVSIPRIIPRGDVFERGLVRPGSVEIDPRFPMELASEISASLTALNFENVRIDDVSPFELFVTATRGGS